MQEPVPLATLHNAVLEFLRGRDDAALFGAQAVNAYVSQPRMTQDVDIMSTRAEQLADALRQELADRFQIAIWIRVVAEGSGYRLYQLRKPKNRHLVGVRAVTVLPRCRRLEEVLVPDPAVLICQKIVSMIRRPNSPKGMTDIADLQRMLLAFPALKTVEGAVAEELRAAGVEEMTMDAWHNLVAQEIVAEDDDDDDD